MNFNRKFKLILACITKGTVTFLSVSFIANTHATESNGYVPPTYGQYAKEFTSSMNVVDYVGD